MPKERNPVAQCPTLTALVLALTALVAGENTPASDALISDATNPVFAEPLSGRPVPQYLVVLPTQQDQSVEFDVPHDCSAIRKHLDTGTADRSRVIERRLWAKADADCRYYALLNRHDQDNLVDFIGEVDFSSLDLRSLPLDTYCDRRPGSLCVPKADAALDARPLFPSKADVPADKREKYASTPCHLTAGGFRGRVCREGESLLCVPDVGSTFRLLNVDYGDINGDGVRDAVLRMTVLSPRTGRRLVRIPVTRLSEGGALRLTQPHRKKH